MSKCKFIISLFVMLSPGFLFSQNMSELYKKADNYESKFTSKYYYEPSSVKAVNNSPHFTYQTQTPKGTEFYLIDAKEGKQRSLFDQERLSDTLSILLKRKIEPYKLHLKEISLSKELSTIYFSLYNKEYFIDLDNYSVKEKRQQDSRNRNHWGDNSTRKVSSPDGKKEAYISEGNLWIEEKANNKKTKLSDDGSPSEYYLPEIYWSPDSKKIIGCKYRLGGDRQLHLISSSPKDQLQPKMEQFNYAKPGDALPIRQPVAFIVDEEKVIHFNLPDAAMQYDLKDIKWDEGSNYFTFDFNKRGHQQYIVYAADLGTQKLRHIVNEESETFIY